MVNSSLPWEYTLTHFVPGTEGMIVCTKNAFCSNCKPWMEERQLKFLVGLLYAERERTPSVPLKPASRSSSLSKSLDD